MLEDTPVEILDISTERDLLRRAQAGDQRAMGRLLKAHYSAMYGLALRYAEDHDRALDALQESCLLVVRKIGQFRSESRFVSWMGRIVINSVRIGFRDQRRLVFMPAERWEMLPENQPSPEELALSRSTLNDVRHELGREDNGDLNLFVQRYVVGRTIRALSADLGVSVPALKTRVHRARARLKQSFRTREASLAS